MEYYRDINLTVWFESYVIFYKAHGSNLAEGYDILTEEKVVCKKFIGFEKNSIIYESREGYDLFLQRKKTLLRQLKLEKILNDLL